MPSRMNFIIFYIKTIVLLMELQSIDLFLLLLFFEKMNFLNIIFKLKEVLK